MSVQAPCQTAEAGPQLSERALHQHNRFVGFSEGHRARGAVRHGALEIALLCSVAADKPRDAACSHFFIACDNRTQMFLQTR